MESIERTDKVPAKMYRYSGVISACSYTWMGFSNILSEQAVCPIRIAYDSEGIVEDELKVINEGDTTLIAVFLQDDISTILLTIKKLTYLMGYSRKHNHIIIFSELPGHWLYQMIYALVNDKSKMDYIRVGSSLQPFDGYLHQKYPLLKDVVMNDELGQQKAKKGLTGKELEAVLNYYLGRSLKLQSVKSGLATKTIYSHRLQGLRKLDCLKQWLKEIKVSRRLNTIRRELIY